MAKSENNSVEKIWELTDYEKERKPQQLITDNTEIIVSSKTLHQELRCPICLEMLSTTMTTRECLHRFCAHCITTALRSGNKECPTCRKKLISKRCLRPDPNFDQIIATIYPNRDEFDKHQEKTLASAVKSDPEIEIIMRLLGNENTGKTRYMKTSSDATVEHLSKYLIIRPDNSQGLKMAENQRFGLCACADRSIGHYENLNYSTHLGEVKRKYAPEKPLELYYYPIN